MTSITGTSQSYDLPSWASHWRNNHCVKKLTADETVQPAEVRLTVVIPAYNEEQRLRPMLEEAIPYLDEHYGRGSLSSAKLHDNTNYPPSNSNAVRMRGTKNMTNDDKGGYEIIIIDDGSRDNTVNLALHIAADHSLGDNFRVVKLEKNRGKGGAVTHGMRHARGQYVLFADADGASTFEDLSKLMKACKEVEDIYGRGIAIGSRAHMVGQDAVIKVCQESIMLPLTID